MCLDPLLIVLEYLPYGDLLGYLRKSRGHSDSYNTGEKKPASKLTAKDLLSFAWMIADGMHFLAKMKVSCSNLVLHFLLHKLQVPRESMKSIPNRLAFVNAKMIPP